MFTRTRGALALPNQNLYGLFLFHLIGVYSFDDDPTDSLPLQSGDDEQNVDIAKKIKERKRRVRRGTQWDVPEGNRQGPSRHERKRKGRSMYT
jgi:hypothetical protein